ncbi:S1 family peptidase [Geminocystis sp. CENA526]|uniref:S1 family peptidase n=1 Tax=Geminocystis sp. CENA526 TaxID=1355871 RepID=UPI003D6FDC3F
MVIFITLLLVGIFWHLKTEQQTELVEKIRQRGEDTLTDNGGLGKNGNSRKKSDLLNEQQLKIQARLITVRIFSSDEKGGSGVIIGEKNGVYYVITNNHVVSDTNVNYKIQTYRNKVYLAEVIWQNNQDIVVDDLALLKFSSKEKYGVVKLKNDIKNNEKILASGFPFQDNFTQSSNLKYTLGYVNKILSQPLIGGYKLGYTNNIYSGMSGGSILNEKGELIGINALGSYPFLGNHYIYQNGTIIPEKEVAIMEELSWGLSSSSIENLINKLQQKGLINFNLNQEGE